MTIPLSFLTTTAFVSNNIPSSTSLSTFGRVATTTILTTSTTVTRGITYAPLHAISSKTAAMMIANTVVRENPAIKSAALAFFNSIRIPATLIAGSSIAAIFTLTGKVNDTSHLSKNEVLALRLYHVFSMISFCLSMNAVLVSTSASTLLLLNKYSVPADSELDVYHFLRQVLNYEFVITRWSFLNAVLFFLCTVTCRAMVEFNLLSRKRRTAGVMVLSTMGGVITLMLSYINTSLNCWPTLWDMSKEVVKLLWVRAAVQKRPLQIVSLLLFAVASVCVCKFLSPSTTAKEQMEDLDGFT